MDNARYQRFPSRHLDRRVHMWTFGWWGQPVLVFPTAAGMAHEWQASGAVEALWPLLAAGRIKLYCPESNAVETWMDFQDSPTRRIRRHQAYERFIMEELVPWIRQDCHSPDLRLCAAGASLGALYAANFALKQPETFAWSLCLSGRYRVDRFFDGQDDVDIYYNHPMAYVPNLHGAALERVRRQTSLTLVVGTGPFEGGCIEETQAMADQLAARGIPHQRDIWGKDVAHHWSWWTKQLVHHLGSRFG